MDATHKKDLIKEAVIVSLTRTSPANPHGITEDAIYRDIKGTTGQQYPMSDIRIRLTELQIEGIVETAEVDNKTVYRLSLKQQRVCILDEDAVRYCTQM